MELDFETILRIGRNIRLDRFGAICIDLSPSYQIRCWPRTELPVVGTGIHDHRESRDVFVVQGRITCLCYTIEPSLRGECLLAESTDGLNYSRIDDHIYATVLKEAQTFDVEGYYSLGPGELHAEYGQPGSICLIRLFQPRIDNHRILWTVTDRNPQPEPPIVDLWRLIEDALD